MTTVRKARPQEFEAIVDFQLKMALETENLLLDKQIVTKGVKAVFNDRSKGCYYVACIEDVVIASLLTTYEWSDWRNGTVIWIQSVFVVPEYRRNGIFRAMYEYIMEIVNNEDEYKGIRLYVDKTNKAAQKVYQALAMNGEHYQLYEWMTE